MRRSPSAPAQRSGNGGLLDYDVDGVGDGERPIQGIGEEAIEVSAGEADVQSYRHLFERQQALLV
jgi:hypothetical protein